MGLSVLDVSTGEFLATQFKESLHCKGLQEQLEVFAPREIIFPNSLSPLLNRRLNGTDGSDGTNRTDRNDRPDAERAEAAPLSDAGFRPSSLSDSEFSLPSETTLTPLDDWVFGFDHADSLLRSQFSVTSLDGFGLTGQEYAVCAAGAAIHYINETQKVSASHLSEISYFETNDYLVLDAPTVEQLGAGDFSGRERGAFALRRARRNDDRDGRASAEAMGVKAVGQDRRDRNQAGFGRGVESLGDQSETGCDRSWSRWPIWRGSPARSLWAGLTLAT